MKIPDFGRVPLVATGLSRQREALAMATALTAGLIFFAPTLSWATNLPLLLWVTLVVGVYTVIIVSLRRILSGVYVTVLVTMTFGANVPLASKAYLESMPGMIGPNLWLFQAPLLFALAIVVLTDTSGASDFRSLRIEYLFGSFVVWTIVSGGLGAVRRTDTALFFALFVLHGLIVFAIVVRSIRHDLVGFRTTVLTLTIAIVGHASYGFVQILNRGTLGFTHLGEISSALSSNQVGVMWLGPFGPYPLGLFVSGFTGMAYILASLLVLVLPVLLAIAIQEQGAKKVAATAGFLLSVIVLRFTTTDAGRGGFIIAMVSLILLIVVLEIEFSFDRVRTRMNSVLRRSPVTTVVTILLSLPAAIFGGFYPSSKSGAKSKVDTGSRGGNSSLDSNTKTDGTGDSGTTSTADGEGATGGAGVDDVDVLKDIDGISIPYFDLSHLGPRVEQYEIGIDLFVKNPIFGIGGGNFRYVAAEYGVSNPPSLHNIYLLLLVETGIPGLVLYLSAVGCVLWNGLAIARRGGPDRVIALALVAGMTGYLAFAFWDHLALDRYTSFLPFWAFAGALVGKDRRDRDESTSSGIQTSK